MRNVLSAWIENRRTIRTLTRLSDRELADFGIDRDHIKAVVTRAAADRTSSATDDATMAPSWGHHNRRPLAA